MFRVYPFPSGPRKVFFKKKPFLPKTKKQEFTKGQKKNTEGAALAKDMLSLSSNVYITLNTYPLLPTPVSHQSSIPRKSWIWRPHPRPQQQAAFGLPPIKHSQLSSKKKTTKLLTTETGDQKQRNRIARVGVAWNLHTKTEERK